MRWQKAWGSLWAATPARGAYRPDIDGLRAIAVLAVLAFHFAPNWMPGGFIGVDVFFVISGYLITGILVHDFEAGRFSFRHFYARRIRRIFPPLALILLFCLVVGWLVLNGSEYEGLGKHVFGGAAYIENFVLWDEAGYFDTGAISKPLLHLWSLAVEEQFYLLWPIILYATLHARRSLAWLAGSVVLASFALGQWQILAHDATSAFYLPLSRAWELLAGAWLVAIAGKRDSKPLPARTATFEAMLGLLLIGIGLLYVREDNFPGWPALFPVLGTMAFIHAGGASTLNRRLLAWRPLVGIGLISYALYLWHWVLWSLTWVVFGRAEPAAMNLRLLTIATASLLLSWLSYRFIERPIRQRGRTGTTLVLFLLVAILGLAGLWLWQSNGYPKRPGTLINSQLVEQITASAAWGPQREACHNRLAKNIDRPDWYCTLGDKSATTTMLVYGDSHAMALLPAIDRYGQEHHVRMVASTESSCLPLVGIRDKRYLKGQNWEPFCTRLASRALGFARMEKPAAVVFANCWTANTGGTTHPRDLRDLLTPDGTIVSSHAQRLALVRHALRDMIGEYAKHGIPVLLIEDVAQQKLDLPLSELRIAANENLMMAFVNRTSVSRAEHAADQLEVNAMLKSLADAEPTLYLANTDAALCNSAYCPWIINGKFMYVNEDHLSVSGAMQAYPSVEVALNNILHRSHEQAARGITPSSPKAMSRVPAAPSSFTTH